MATTGLSGEGTSFFFGLGTGLFATSVVMAAPATKKATHVHSRKTSQKPELLTSHHCNMMEQVWVWCCLMAPGLMKHIQCHV